jgi:cytidylate kinase
VSRGAARTASVVAIDGPAGAGKSTVARAVADRLGWRYLDTGAMYRAVALAALEEGIDPEDGASLERLATSLDIGITDDRVTVDGRDVTAEIRSGSVTDAASKVSRHAGVRRALVGRQRALAQSGRVVIEGRDIGTVVVPDAALKVFLVASSGERARRRARQLGLPEDEGTLAGIERDLLARDEVDASRSESPFSQVPDAVVMDSTDKDVDQLAEEIVRRIPVSLR